MPNTAPSLPSPWLASQPGKLPAEHPILGPSNTLLNTLNSTTRNSTTRNPNSTTTGQTTSTTSDRKALPPSPTSLLLALPFPSFLPSPNPINHPLQLQLGQLQLDQLQLDQLQLDRRWRGKDALLTALSPPRLLQSHPDAGGESDSSATSRSKSKSKSKSKRKSKSRTTRFGWSRHGGGVGERSARKASDLLLHHHPLLPSDPNTLPTSPAYGLQAAILAPNPPLPLQPPPPSNLPFQPPPPPLLLWRATTARP